MKKSGLMVGSSILGFLISLNFISAASTWSIQSTLQIWADAGVFLYLLPFLLVFALIFAILTKSNLIGNNKPAIVIISAALGLMSLIGDYFPKFLERFAPNISIAISVLLGIMILLGLFYNEDKAKGAHWIIYVFIGVGILAFLFVLGDTFGTRNYYAGDLWGDYGPALITLLIIGAIVASIVKASNKKP